MSTLEVVLAIISIISFIIGLVSFIRAEFIKIKEKSSVGILKEKLISINQGLLSLFYTADSLVQIPKRREVSLEEIQDIARILRTQIYTLSDNIKEAHDKLEKVKYGELYKSTEIKNIQEILSEESTPSKKK